MISRSEKAGSTSGCSQAVPHPSTNQALCRLTSEVRRDPVYSTRYGRQRNSLSASVSFALRSPRSSPIKMERVKAFRLAKKIFNA